MKSATKILTPATVEVWVEKYCPTAVDRKLFLERFREVIRLYETGEHSLLPQKWLDTAARIYDSEDPQPLTADIYELVTYLGENRA
jgi:hypothetical protein